MRLDNAMYEKRVKAFGVLSRIGKALVGNNRF